MAAGRDPPLDEDPDARLRRQALAACIDDAALARLNAALRVMTLTVLAARNLGLDPAYGIDVFRVGFARGAGKPVVWLETPELPMQALLGADPSQTRALLQEGLADLEAGRAAPRLARIAQVWADGDHDRLSRCEEWCECLDKPSDKVLLKRLLDEPNPALAERVAQLHISGCRFSRPLTACR